MEQVVERNRECEIMVLAITPDIPDPIQHIILQFVGPFHTGCVIQNVITNCCGSGDCPTLSRYDLSFEWCYHECSRFLLRALDVVCVGKFQFRPDFHIEGSTEWGYETTYVLEGKYPDFTLTLDDVMNFIAHCQLIVFRNTGFCDPDHCFFEGIYYVRVHVIIW